MSQYALSLSLPPIYSVDTFFVSACNREAWRWIDAWPAWPAHALLLHGPEGSGKSHLGHIWAQKSQATVMTAADLPAGHAPGHRLVEDIEQLADERALLHLFNASRENNSFLLLTAGVAPAVLPFALPDLTSRLLAIPAAAIGQPDDDVLAFAMRKQFADRQMAVGEDVIAWLCPRMERSLTAVKTLVERLDRAALAEQKNLTIPFVKKILG